MEAFVYCWTNHSKNKKYVGYHKGSTDDGYICSSRSEIFWEDWNTDKWSRQIIAQGTMEDCVVLEHAILRSIDLNSDEWYNNGCGRIVFTDEVRKKMSVNNASRRKEVKEKMRQAKLGRKLSDEHKKKLHDGRRNSKNSKEHNEALRRAATGKKISEETREKMRQTKLGKTISEEHRESLRVAKRKRDSDPEERRKHSERMKLWWAERKKNGSD